MHLGFTPSRLTIARKRRGLSKIDLSVAVGVSPRMISNYEAGGKAPSAETVEKLSRVLGFPPDFFQGGSIEVVPPTSASFRSLSTMTAGQRDSVLAAAAIAIEINRQFERDFNLPKANVPDLRGHDPETAAEEVRALWGRGVQSIPSIVHLMEANGVRVFSLSDECAATVDGFSFWAHGTPYVFLNPNKSGERGRFDASHELGHLVLHQDGTPAGREEEREADKFASAFLMPAPSVISVAPRLPSLETLVELKKYWNVSVGALVRRLYDLELIGDWQYRSLSIEIAQRGWRTQEPNGIQRETSLLLRKLFAALREEGVGGRARFARELRISVAELDSFVFGLVPIAMDGGAGGDGPRAGRLRLVE